MTSMDLSGNAGQPAAAHPALGADDPALSNTDRDAPAVTSSDRPDPNPANVRDEGDVFALLAGKAAEFQAEQATLCEVFGYKDQFRIRCTRHVDEKPMRRWQRAAVPQKMRKGGGNVSPFDVDNVVLAIKVILGTALELAVWSDRAQGYVEVPSDETCPFDDKKIMGQLGVILPANAVRAVFGGQEALIVRASSRIMAYAGWNPDESLLDQDDDEDDDELDPTPGR